MNFGRPSNGTPFVEMEVEMLDGTRHLIRRTILLPTSGRLTDTESMLEIDGNNALGFAELGIAFTPAHNPVIVQHGIQDFIHTRPIDQYRAVSEAIGLARLINFKDVLERARNRYKSNPPTEVLEAEKRVQPLIAQIEANPKLSGLARRWANGEFNETRDSGEIFAIAREAVGIAEGDA